MVDVYQRDVYYRIQGEFYSVVDPVFRRDVDVRLVPNFDVFIEYLQALQEDKANALNIHTQKR